MKRVIVYFSIFLLLAAILDYQAKGVFAEAGFWGAVVIMSILMFVVGIMTILMLLLFHAK